MGMWGSYHPGTPVPALPLSRYPADAEFLVPACCLYHLMGNILHVEAHVAVPYSSRESHYNRLQSHHFESHVNFPLWESNPLFVLFRTEISAVQRYMPVSARRPLMLFGSRLNHILCSHYILKDYDLP